MRKLMNPLLHPILKPKDKPNKAGLLITHAADDASTSLLDRGDGGGLPPKGYLAVYVGEEMQRFVIPALYLSLPPFQRLMAMAEEEFGFEQEGGLHIPCGVEDFEEVLRALGGSPQGRPRRPRSRRLE